MVVQKTLRRHGVTLEHGAFEVRESVHVCKAGCHYPSGVAATRRSQALAQLIPRGGVFGYDIIVHVGLQRFVYHRQRDEIRAVLKNDGISLSTGEISTLCVRFVNYLEVLHEARSESIREALASDGGWPLHIDATGEDGRGTLLVALAGWRHWVLGSWKIPTERAEAILPRLRSVVDRFGPPCAVVRDLGRAMIPAAADLVAELKLPIPVLACHQHFLADVGKDLLKEIHGKLRESFRRFRIRPRLRTLARDLGRNLSDSIGQARQAVHDWQQQAHGDHVLPRGRDGLAVIRALTQWVLDYAADSTYQTFPYDRPYLDLYDRCSRARRAADAFLRCLPDDRALRQNLGRFCSVLDPFLSDAPTAQLTTTLRARAALFDELRDTLRLVPRPTRCEQSTEDTANQLNDIRKDLRQWVAALRQRRPERGPAKDTRQAIDLILDHMVRHGYSLWGHVISLPVEAGGGVRVVDRTNNILENFFRDMKHGERRRSGRKILTQDFERLPPAAALVCNLTCPDYVEIVCGTLKALPAAFAELDAKHHEAKRLGLALPQLSQRAAETDPVSASLPTADRRLVRTEAMNLRLEKAARSRAPRTSQKAG